MKQKNTVFAREPFHLGSESALAEEYVSAETFSGESVENCDEACGNLVESVTHVSHMLPGAGGDALIRFGESR